MSSPEESENHGETANLFGDVFIYDHLLHKSECILEKNGQKCGVKLATTRPFNLKRHVKSQHRDFSAQIVENNCNHNIEKELLDMFAEMFAVNGRPFSLFKDSSFQKFYKLLIEQIEQNKKQKICIDLDKIKAHINVTSNDIKTTIENEVKNLPIALMMDIATKNNRSILGINIQYVVGNRIVLRTLGMIRLNESHTGRHLAQIVKQKLDDFGISMEQLFAVTTDNAGYMLLSSEILDQLAEEVNGENIPESVDEIEEDFYRGMLKEAEREFMNYSTPDHVKSIPCGAHLFQLAIKDAFLMSPNADALIILVRNIAKKLRTPRIIQALREKNLKFPLLDNATRWDGKYTMVSN